MSLRQECRRCGQGFLSLEGQGESLVGGLDGEAMLAPGEGPEMVSRTLFQYAGWNLAAEWDQFGGHAAPRTLAARYYREGGLDSTFAATFGAGASAKDYVAITDHLGSPIVLLRVQAGGALGFLAEPAESISYDPYGRPTVHVPFGTSLPGQPAFTAKGWLVEARGATARTGVRSNHARVDTAWVPLTQWGPLASMSSTGWRLLFTQRDYEPGAQAYWYRLRWYDPAQGRFWSRDPLGYEPGLVQYAYCNGNPVNFTDPWGLRVMGTFDRRTGTLFLMDMDDLSRSVTIKAESGGKPWGDAIPLGPYRILEHPSDGFFRLEPEDSDWGNDEYDSSTDPDNGRGLFRLHHPGNTTGCIAAADIGEWDLLEHLLDETRRGRTPVLSKRKLGRFLPGAAIEWLDDYGTLDVIESAPPVVVPPTLHPSAAGSWISYV